MSREHLIHLLLRARTYAGFRRMLERDPALALLDYDLSDAEREALLDRDPRALDGYDIDHELAHWWCAPAVPAAADG